MVLPSSLPAVLAGIALTACFLTPSRAEQLTLPAQSREEVEPGTWEVAAQTLTWDAEKTAVVVCDMWDRHWCPGATDRVGEMAPRMNEFLKAARAKGMFIIHCPSSTLDFYKDHPARKRALAAPKAETKIPLQGWCHLDPDKEAPLPIDDADGGCDSCPSCKPHRAWTRQIATLEIRDEDAITDSAEAYHLMRERGITNVIVMGVHTNMCVLGRPFSIRQMCKQGQNVVLVRDLTDAMYNPRSAPYVNHFRGTQLVIEHIEKYWCPSLTSTALLGGEPFRFQADHPPKVVIRTASHAFAPRGKDAETGASWPEFDPEVLGGNYNGHHGKTEKTTVSLPAGVPLHPVLTGIRLDQLIGNGSLYKTGPLKTGARPALLGTIPDQPTEPVAWTHANGPKNAKVFYTSFGHLDDFANPQFRRLLLNGILWALDKPIPPDDRLQPH